MHNITQVYHCIGTTLLMQGGSVIPNILSTRIAFACVLCTSILFYYHWEAMVISYVAVKKISWSIKSLDEFALNPINHKVGKEVLI